MATTLFLSKRFLPCRVLPPCGGHASYPAHPKERNMDYIKNHMLIAQIPLFKELASSVSQEHRLVKWKSAR
jgi:hypothetical protein